MFKYILMTFTMIGCFSTPVFAQSIATLQCSIKVFRPASGSASERVSLEKQATVELTNSNNAGDLQMMLSGDDIMRAYGAHVVFMGNIFRTPAGDKIKLGVYVLQSAHRLLDGAIYWKGPSESDLEGYYAQPIAESVFKYTASGEYQIDVGRRFGSMDNARATIFKCH